MGTTMDRARMTLRSLWDRDGGLVVYGLVLLALMQIGGSFGLLAGLGSTLALIAAVAGVQVATLQYRKPARYRAGPKPHWRELKAEREAERAEDIRGIALSVLPLVVFLPFVALASSVDVLARLLAG